MNPILAGQLIQLIQFLIAQGLNIKENDAYNGTVKPEFVAALSENRPVADAVMASIHTDAQTAHDDLANA